jgi:hypothetical protein
MAHREYIQGTNQCGAANTEQRMNAHRECIQGTNQHASAKTEQRMNAHREYIRGANQRAAANTEQRMNSSLGVHPGSQSTEKQETYRREYIQPGSLTEQGLKIAIFISDLYSKVRDAPE